MRNLGTCASTGGFHKDAVHAGVASLNYGEKLLALMNVSFLAISVCKPTPRRIAASCGAEACRS